MAIITLGCGRLLCVALENTSAWSADRLTHHFKKSFCNALSVCDFVVHKPHCAQQVWNLVGIKLLQDTVFHLYPQLCPRNKKLHRCIVDALGVSRSRLTQTHKLNYPKTKEAKRKQAKLSFWRCSVPLPATRKHTQWTTK